MLEGRTILVVERQFLIAMDIQRILDEAGASTVVFARSVEEARGLASGWSGFGLAVIELAPDVPDADALALDLSELGVPLVLTASEITEAHRADSHPPVLMKPFGERDLLAACARALGQHCLN